MKRFAAVLCLGVAVMRGARALAQEPAAELVEGLKLERELGPADQHVYITPTMEAGAAIIGEAGQQGIDFVIDIFGPDCRQITRLEDFSGAEGPQPFKFTALQSGTFKFVVDSPDKNAKPGKYTLKIGRILTPDENAKRLASEKYSSKTLYDLWEASLTNPKAVESFVASRGGKPVIEAIPGNASEMQVTFFIVGDQYTESAELNGGPDYLGMKMDRVGQTNLFFASEAVPLDARFVYAFHLYKVHRAGPRGEVELRETVHTDDSVLEMPKAPPQQYVLAREGVPRGETSLAVIKSTILNEDRKITVYAPPGYDSKTAANLTAANLLIVFDGEAYGALPGSAPMPLPTIIDNLISDKKIGPTVALLVWAMGKRDRDLTSSRPFADFVAEELVPWARSLYRIAPGPKHVVVAGSSLGALEATYCAFIHSEVIGNVISQSGSYWFTRNWQTEDADFAHRLYPRETGMMIEAFKASNRLPIRFFMEIGVYDLGAGMLGANRELRDILQLKGYDVDYHEFDGGHNYTNWRGTLGDALIALLGRHPRRTSANEWPSWKVTP